MGPGKVFRNFTHPLLWGATALLFVVGVLQLFQVSTGYSLTWLKRIWRNQSQTAFERSANFYLGDSGSKFMRFLDEIIPVDKDVVVAERSAQFSNQEVLQYFLFPRSIVGCNCQLGLQCFSCLAKPDTYIPVTRQFPPEELSTDRFAGVKKLIKAPIDSDYYLGVYAPLSAPSTGNAHTFAVQPFHLWKTLILDLFILLGFWLPGIAVIHLLVPSLSLVESGALSIPVGGGLFTWVLFLISWVGIPLTAVSLILIYLAFTILILAAARIMKVKFHFRLPDFRSADFLHLNKIGWLVIGLVWVLLVILSIGRSYSLYDDIVIWSLKGHGIAASGSIFAEHLGGHGLAYPLNIPIQVAIFKLLDGDLLPGSKFMPPLALLALLSGIYHFCRRQGVPPLPATCGSLLVLSTPAIFFYATTGFANIAFTSYLVLGVLWSYEGLEQNNHRSLLLGGLLFALAGWTRPEGILYAFTLVMALLVARWISRQPWHFSVGWLLPLCIIPGTWLVFAHGYIASDQAGGALKGLWQGVLSGQLYLTPLKTMAAFMVDQLSNGGDWRTFSILGVLFVSFALIRKIVRPIPLPLVMLSTSLVALVFIIGIFYIESTSEVNFSQFLGVSFDRSIFPTVVLLIVTGLMLFRSLPDPGY